MRATFRMAGRLFLIACVIGITISSPIYPHYNRRNHSHYKILSHTETHFQGLFLDEVTQELKTQIGYNKSVVLTDHKRGDDIIRAYLEPRKKNLLDYYEIEEKNLNPDQLALPSENVERILKLDKKLEEKLKSDPIEKHRSSAESIDEKSTTSYSSNDESTSKYDSFGELMSASSIHEEKVSAETNGNEVQKESTQKAMGETEEITDVSPSSSSFADYFNAQSDEGTSDQKPETSREEEMTEVSPTSSSIADYFNAQSDEGDTSDENPKTSKEVSEITEVSPSLTSFDDYFNAQSDEGTSDQKPKTSKEEEMTEVSPSSSSVHYFNAQSDEGDTSDEKPKTSKEVSEITEVSPSSSSVDYFNAQSDEGTSDQKPETAKEEEMTEVSPSSSSADYFNAQSDEGRSDQKPETSKEEEITEVSPSPSSIADYIDAQSDKGTSYQKPETSKEVSEMTEANPTSSSIADFDSQSDEMMSPSRDDFIVVQPDEVYPKTAEKDQNHTELLAHSDEVYADKSMNGNPADFIDSLSSEMTTREGHIAHPDYTTSKKDLTFLRHELDNPKTESPNSEEKLIQESTRKDEITTESFKEDIHDIEDEASTTYENEWKDYEVSTKIHSTVDFETSTSYVGPDEMETSTSKNEETQHFSTTESTNDESSGEKNGPEKITSSENEETSSSKENHKESAETKENAETTEYLSSTVVYEVEESKEQLSSENLEYKSDENPLKNNEDSSGQKHSSGSQEAETSTSYPTTFEESTTPSEDFYDEKYSGDKSMSPSENVETIEDSFERKSQEKASSKENHKKLEDSSKTSEDLSTFFTEENENDDLSDSNIPKTTQDDVSKSSASFEETESSTLILPTQRDERSTQDLNSEETTTPSDDTENSPENIMSPSEKFETIVKGNQNSENESMEKKSSTQSQKVEESSETRRGNEETSEISTIVYEDIEPKMPSSENLEYESSVKKSEPGSMEMISTTIHETSPSTEISPFSNLPNNSIIISLNNNEYEKDSTSLADEIESLTSSTEESTTLDTGEKSISPSENEDFEKTKSEEKVSSSNENIKNSDSNLLAFSTEEGHQEHSIDFETSTVGSDETSTSKNEETHHFSTTESTNDESSEKFKTSSENVETSEPSEETSSSKENHNESAETKENAETTESPSSTVEYEVEESKHQLSSENLEYKSEENPLKNNEDSSEQKHSSGSQEAETSTSYPTTFEESTTPSEDFYDEKNRDKSMSPSENVETIDFGFETKSQEKASSKENHEESAETKENAETTESLSSTVVYEVEESKEQLSSENLEYKSDENPLKNNEDSSGSQEAETSTSYPTTFEESTTPSEDFYDEKNRDKSMSPSENVETIIENEKTEDNFESSSKESSHTKENFKNNHSLPSSTENVAEKVLSSTIVYEESKPHSSSSEKVTWPENDSRSTFSTLSPQESSQESMSPTENKETRILKNFEKAESNENTDSMLVLSGPWSNVFDKEEITNASKEEISKNLQKSEEMSSEYNGIPTESMTSETVESFSTEKIYFDNLEDKEDIRKYEYDSAQNQIDTTRNVLEETPSKNGASYEEKRNFNAEYSTRISTETTENVRAKGSEIEYVVKPLEEEKTNRTCKRKEKVTSTSQNDSTSKANFEETTTEKENPERTTQRYRRTFTLQLPRQKYHQFKLPERASKLFWFV